MISSFLLLTSISIIHFSASQETSLSGSFTLTQINSNDIIQIDLTPSPDQGVDAKHLLEKFCMALSIEELDLTTGHTNDNAVEGRDYTVEYVGAIDSAPEHCIEPDSPDSAIWNARITFTKAAETKGYSIRSTITEPKMEQGKLVGDEQEHKYDFVRMETDLREKAEDGHKRVFIYVNEHAQHLSGTLKLDLDDVR